MQNCRKCGYRRVYYKLKRKRDRKKKQKINFSKILMLSIVILCLEIVIYAEIAMIYLADLSALYALIGIVASLAIGIWAYCEKSAKENTKGGITYDLAMMSQTDPLKEEDPDDSANNEED